MMDIDSLWGEPSVEPAAKKRVAITKKVKDTSVGFRMQLGTCHRPGKGGTTVKVPILIAKDSRCWILRIGSQQTYPSSLVGVFKEIAQAEALQLKDDADIDDLIAHQTGVEEYICEMGRLLDQRIKEFILKSSKKTKR